MLNGLKNSQLHAREENERQVPKQAYATGMVGADIQFGSSRDCFPIREDESICTTVLDPTSQFPS